MPKASKAISLHKYYCAGYGNPGNVGSGHILGVVLSTSSVKRHLSHPGSQGLDNILAFDSAEIQNTTLGQINMITVSSFCGPTGYIWGYDIAPHPKLHQSHPLAPKDSPIPVYSASPLLEATRHLFGSVSSPAFPLLPGSHVPCAEKSLIVPGPAHIYSAIGIGIPKNRAAHACLLMEDVGYVTSPNSYRAIIKSLAQSLLDVGQNQQVSYKEIFVEIDHLPITKNHIGCALVAAPYFALAKKAIPKAGFTSLSKTSLTNWKKSVLV